MCYPLSLIVHIPVIIVVSLFIIILLKFSSWLYHVAFFSMVLP